MATIKIFSGSEILATALQKRLEAVDVQVIKKDNIQSARLGGFGNSDLAVELFIDESQYNRAHQVIEDFRMSI
ncbi:MAG TPA: DUF2007 domain-containing protein [Flavobacterium sp.]|jgi:hypothetical protein